MLHRSNCAYNFVTVTQIGRIMAGRKRKTPQWVDGKPSFDDMPVHYQVDQAELAERLLGALEEGRIGLLQPRQHDAAVRALRQLGEASQPADQRLVAEWVDAHLTASSRTKLLGALRQERFRATRGIRQVALKPSEFQQLQLLRDRAEQRRRGPLSHADRALLRELGAILPPHLTQVVSVPLYSHTVPAGQPAPADDDIEDLIDLNDYLLPHRESSFLVRVKGESMLEAGIRDGDLLVVDRARPPSDGKIVVAALNGELTVKRLSTRHGQVRLMPANPAFAPIEIDEASELMIWGVVSNVIHKL